MLPVKKEFQIVDYKPQWKKEYEKESSRLISIIGGNLKSIHHIGSTAILNTMAKPEIDILVVIRNEKRIADHNLEIEKLGYQIRTDAPQTPNFPHRFYYSKDIENVRTHKLHICLEGHPAIGSLLLFVKYLNENNEEAVNYANLKVDLAKKYNYGRNIMKYIEGKTAFISRILAKAQQHYSK